MGKRSLAREQPNGDDRVTDLLDDAVLAHSVIQLNEERLPESLEVACDGARSVRGPAPGTKNIQDGPMRRKCRVPQEVSYCAMLRSRWRQQVHELGYELRLLLSTVAPAIAVIVGPLIGQANPGMRQSCRRELRWKGRVRRIVAQVGLVPVDISREPDRRVLQGDSEILCGAIEHVRGILRKPTATLPRFLPVLRERWRRRVLPQRAGACAYASASSASPG
jgi:hypothetical protein